MPHSIAEALFAYSMMVTPPDVRPRSLAHSWQHIARGGLQLVNAQISAGIESEAVVTAPTGTHISRTVLEGADMRCDARASATLNYTVQSLNVTGANGQTFGLVGPSLLDDVKHDFASEFSNFTEGRALDTPAAWSFVSNVNGLGHVGKVLSVVVNSQLDDSVTLPISTTRPLSFDLTTGEQLRLSRLLTPVQLAQLRKTVELQLSCLKNPELGIDGAAFTLPSLQTLDVDFGLTSKNDQLFITTAVNNGSAAVAHFTFAAPTTADFRSRLGLD